MHWLLASVVISLLLGVSIRQLQRGTSWRPSTSIASGPLERPGVQKTSKSILKLSSRRKDTVHQHHPCPLASSHSMSWNAFKALSKPGEKDPFLTSDGVCKTILYFPKSSHVTDDCAEIKNSKLRTVYSEKTSTRKNNNEVWIFYQPVSPPHLPHNTVLWHQKICRKPPRVGNLNS